MEQDFLNALEEILAMCVSHESYRVYAELLDIAGMKDFLDAMKEQSDDNPWSVNVKERKVKFKNGSFIKVSYRGAPRVAQGCTYHKTLCVGGDNPLNDRISVVDYCNVEERADGEKDPLESFLEGFKVKIAG